MLQRDKSPAQFSKQRLDRSFDVAVGAIVVNRHGWRTTPLARSPLRVQNRNHSTPLGRNHLGERGLACAGGANNQDVRGIVWVIVHQTQPGRDRERLWEITYRNIADAVTKKN